MDCQPYVSVLIPVRNEAAHIKDLFGPLLSQTYPKDRMEVIVVDGMSNDGTRDIVQRFIETNRYLSVRLVDNPKGQRAAALNIGIKNAAGNVIVRVDARTELPKDYIEKCVATLLETGADNVGGVQRPIVEKTGKGHRARQTQFAIGLAMSHFFGVGNAQFRLGKQSGYVDTVYLGCFRKAVFDKVGLFDQEAAVIGEDTDMNHRIRKAGGKVYLNKDIIAYYYPRDNLKDLWKLYFRYGGARAGNLFKAGRFTAWRQLAPLVLFIALMITAVGSFVNVFFFYPFLGLVLTYLAVDFLVSAWLSVKHFNAGLLFILLFVFPCMHCAWAAGFFRRLFQWPSPGRYWAN
jgi:cellulose synthase/poly-beta-1,6-N-acetylglucosamine synthase-like glycosyltransferase